jgi:hypothetical protein
VLTQAQGLPDKVKSLQVRPGTAAGFAQIASTSRRLRLIA